MERSSLETALACPAAAMPLAWRPRLPGPLVVLGLALTVAAAGLMALGAALLAGLAL